LPDGEEWQMTRDGNSELQQLFAVSGTAELIADGVRSTATALHHGANDWSRALRRAGIARGDRVLCALPNGRAFAQLLVAALTDGVTLVPVPAHESLESLLEQVDARLGVAMAATHPAFAVPSPTGGPPSVALTPRRSTVRTDGVPFLLRSSGTTGEPQWIGLSDAGIMSVLASHLPLLAVDGASVLAALPWHHAFGLVLGLLPALLRSRRIVTTSRLLRTPDAIVAEAAAHAASHMCMVPVTAARLAAMPDGLALLLRLQGGLVGGAAIDLPLAAILRGTRLRVGYGQTEASPGVMAGEPGEFADRLIGRPVGCEVRIENDGVLAFRGPNAYAGNWAAGAFTWLDRGRWQRTGDIVAARDGLFYFIGRNAATFKLSNGRSVDAPQLERQIQQQVLTVADVVLTTTDTRTIDILYSTHDDTPLPLGMVASPLGALKGLVGRAHLVPRTAWVRTGKGEIDRRRLPQIP